VAAAAFQLAVSLLVLFAASLFFRGGIPWTAIFLPIVFLPLLLFVLACVWVVSALGVYLRDLGQIVGHLVTMLMFLSPLFYPEEAIPEKFRGLLQLNPLTYFIDEFRSVLVLGEMPEWTSLALHILFALLAARLGLWFFQRLRPGFSDVL
jgi:lipopolysaccharide transport system permease protein